MYTKLIQTGNMIEIYQYQYEPFINKKRKEKQKGNRTKRKANIAQSSARFRKLVLANLGSELPYLITLTFAEEVSYNESRKRTTEFFRRIGKKYIKKYIAVPEFQRKGRIHYHALIWGIDPKIAQNERNTRILQNEWGYGFVDIKQTDGNEKLAGYLSKYLSKSMQDERLFEKRAYSSSRNVLRPVSITSSSAIEIICEELSINKEEPFGDNKLDKAKVYMTEWLGKCNYYRYKI